MNRQQIKETFNMNDITKVSGLQTMDLDLIDLALFDLMSDRKSRDINEILNSLTLVGFNNRSVNNRMDRHLSRKNWFDRSSGSRVYYTLKKHAVRPKTQSNFKFFGTRAIEPSVDPVKPTIPETRPTPAVVVQSIASPRPIMVASSATATFSKEFLTPFEKAPKPEPTPPLPTPEPVEKPIRTPVILNTDTTKVAVWKYLSDFKPATIAELVDEIDFVSKSSIVNTVCKMQVAGTVTSKMVEDGHGAKAYTMVRGTPMPVTTATKRKAPEIETAPQLTQEQKDLLASDVGQKALEQLNQLASAQKPIEENASNPMDIKNLSKALSDAIETTEEKVPMATTVVNDQTITHPKSAIVAPTILDSIRNEIDRVATTPMEVANYADTPQETARINGVLAKLDGGNIRDGYVGKPQASPSWDAMPLLSVGIQIKGVPYTVAEARELTAELTSVGFGAPDSAAVPGPMKHLSFTVKIAGMDFTPTQANELAMQLLANKLTA